jgi:hypothetical protein
MAPVIATACDQGMAEFLEGKYLPENIKAIEAMLK